MSCSYISAMMYRDYVFINLQAPQMLQLVIYIMFTRAPARHLRDSVRGITNVIRIVRSIVLIVSQT